MKSKKYEGYQKEMMMPGHKMGIDKEQTHDRKLTTKEMEIKLSKMRKRKPYYGKNHYMRG